MAKRRPKKKRKGGAGDVDLPGRWAHGFVLVPLRLYAGAIFLVTAQWKLIESGFSVGEKIQAFREHEYVPMIERAIHHPPEVFGWRLDLYAAFLRDVMLPGAAFFAPAILLFELLLGLTLVLGFGVRLFGSLGVLLMLGFNLAKPMPGWDPEAPTSVGIKLLTVRSANWPLTWILLVLTVLAAGRILGLDVLVRRRSPPWIRWIA